MIIKHEKTDKPIVRFKDLKPGDVFYDSLKENVYIKCDPNNSSAFNLTTYNLRRYYDDMNQVYLLKATLALSEV